MGKSKCPQFSNQQGRIHRSDPESVKFVSLAAIHFRWSAQFAGEHIVGGSETLGSEGVDEAKRRQNRRGQTEKKAARKDERETDLKSWICLLAALE